MNLDWTPLSELTDLDELTLQQGMYIPGEPKIAVRVTYDNGETSYLTMTNSYAKLFAEALLKRIGE